MISYKARLHSAEHLFWSQLRKAYPKLQTEALQFQTDKIRLNYSLPEGSFDADKLKHVLVNTNKIIEQNLPVSTEDLSRDEAAKQVDLSLVPASVKDIRLVKIGNVSTEACIGEHVINSSEIESITNFMTEIKGNKLQVYFSVGDQKTITPDIKSKKSVPQTLKGFRDFLPETMVVRNYVKKILIEVFESFGFEPLETPTLEYSSTLMGKYGDEADKLVYSFTDQGGRQIGMRYDLTVPAAKVLAMYPELPKPFKRYQIQPVYRAEKPQKGRYREVLQCDIDTFGVRSPIADAEIVAVIDRILQKLNFKKYSIRINSRSILTQILETSGITESKNSVLQSLDKFQKIGQDGVTKELVSKGFSEAQIASIFESLKSIKPDQYLVELFSNLDNLGVSKSNYSFDPTLVRGLDYYTGPIFETYVEEPKIGSITGGGRYDKLISTLGGPDIPAVGTTVGLDRIVDCIIELNLLPNLLKTTTRVMVANFGPDTEADSTKLSSTLRGLNINTLLYPTADKLGKQFKYASKLGIPFVAIIGPDEAKNNQVTLKNMATGEQKTISSSEILAQFE